jgi:hypothetical protein
MTTADLGHYPTSRFVSCIDEMDSSRDLVGINVPKSLLVKQ